jgi:6,7-dimethyl-8-ribityllumazine synthase
MTSPKPHFLIVEARFYPEIADALVGGAVAVLDDSGVTYERIQVPGVFEIPTAIHMAIRALDFSDERRRYDGFVALGCVIRGETSHYDYVCGESARKMQDLACDYLLAMGYGILTCENSDQAWARADPEQKDKGGDAARAALDMLGLKKKLRLYPR